MEEPTSSTTYSEQPEPRTDDCFEHIMRREIPEDVFRNKANGDDAGFEDYTEEDELEEDA